MILRQQVLFLWLSESSLVSPVVAWAFHDGSEGRGPALPGREPPYPDGEAALKDGWCLIQSPPPLPLLPGDEHEVGPLRSEYVFERRVELGG